MENQINMVHKRYECPHCDADVILLNGMGNGHLRICQSCKGGFPIEFLHLRGIIAENDDYDKTKVALFRDFDEGENTNPEWKEYMRTRAEIDVNDKSFVYINSRKLKEIYPFADTKDE